MNIGKCCYMVKIMIRVRFLHMVYYILLEIFSNNMENLYLKMNSIYNKMKIK